jgi:hypothetical protein
MKKTAVFILGAVLLFTRSFAAEDKYPACRAALEKVDYGEGFNIPPATRSLIDSYRAGWLALCEPNSRKKPSLAELFEKAKEIESSFTKAFDAFDESILNDSKVDLRRFAIVNDLVSKRYPAFVPAFHGMYGDEEYFSPLASVFRESSPLGNPEDRLFFDSRIPMEKEFPPFIRKTWDYGGCAQFGEFDWTGAMRNIARVEKQVKSAAYLRETSQYEERLFHELASPSNSICTCNAKESVMKDFLNVQKYLKTEPRFAAYVPKIQLSIDSINSRKIDVKSEMEGHCSGG